MLWYLVHREQDYVIAFLREETGCYRLNCAAVTLRASMRMTADVWQRWGTGWDAASRGRSHNRDADTILRWHRELVVRERYWELVSGFG